MCTLLNCERASRYVLYAFEPFSVCLCVYEFLMYLRASLYCYRLNEWVYMCACAFVHDRIKRINWPQQHSCIHSYMYVNSCVNSSLILSACNCCCCRCCLNFFLLLRFVSHSVSLVLLFTHGSSTVDYHIWSYSVV